MSHGRGHGDATVDPNLTSLLDLVLQLLMLFMICGNYASDSNDPVELAKSQTAKQLADTETLQAPSGQNQEDDFLFITVKPYKSADGVRQLALEELQNRENLGASADEQVRKQGYDKETAAHYRFMVDNNDDPNLPSIYYRLKNNEPLDSVSKDPRYLSEVDLLKDLNIPLNSEQDLADHLKGAGPDALKSFKDGDSYVIVPGQKAMLPNNELKKWLDDQHALLVEKHGEDLKTAVVIRADANMDYAVVYHILLLCQDAKFTNLKVRALIQKAPQS
jgi:biopolymer transport protein ExbD